MNGVISPLVLHACNQRRNEFFLREKLALLNKKTRTRFLLRPPQKDTQPPKMAESLPYSILPHGGFSPYLGQKSSYKKSDRTKILFRTPRAIWTSALALRNGFIVRWRP
jgi:hypothetical protein